MVSPDLASNNGCFKKIGVAGVAHPLWLRKDIHPYLSQNLGNSYLLCPLIAAYHFDKWSMSLPGATDSSKCRPGHGGSRTLLSDLVGRKQRKA